MMLEYLSVRKQLMERTMFMAAGQKLHNIRKIKKLGQVTVKCAVKLLLTV